VLIIAPGPSAIGAAETVDKSAIVPAAVFIIVEIVLVAETISVILLDEIDPEKAGAAPIAILLSIALLANLGVVCSVAAAIAAKRARQSKHQGARALSGWLAAVSSRAEGIDFAAGDTGGVDVAAPAARPAMPTSR
jgi:hypothetical protein